MTQLGGGRRVVALIVLLSAALSACSATPNGSTAPTTTVPAVPGAVCEGPGAPPAQTPVAPAPPADPPVANGNVRAAGAEQVDLLTRGPGGRPEITTVPAAQAASVLTEAARGGRPVEAVAAPLRGTTLARRSTTPTPGIPAPTRPEPAVGVDSAVSVDPLRGSQWGLDRVRVDTAWACSRGGGIDIAIVDTGVDATHVDLLGRVQPGMAFLTGATIAGAGGVDPEGHGTAVASVAAAAVDRVGMAGVAPAARILPVRVLDASGSGWVADIARGIVWATDAGAEVINLSLSTDGPSVLLDAALAWASVRGVTVVAAAGNDGVAGPVNAPANDPSVIAVGAIDPGGAVSAMSTRSPAVDLAAPGESILVARSGGGWSLRDGTSFAAPFVSGVVALLRATSPGFDTAAVRTRLERTASDVAPAGRDVDTGWGVVDAAAAVGARPRP